jgi:acyl-CoA thioester hydrolase
MTEFKWPYRIAISDINYGGHMGNDRSLSLFHEARIAYLNSIECSEKDIGDGYGIIMKDAYIDFLAEIFHGDQLEIHVHLGEIKGLLFNLEYQVFRAADHKWVLKGRTGILAFDYQKGKVVRTPSSFFQKIKDKYGH